MWKVRCRNQTAAFRPGPNAPVRVLQGRDSESNCRRAPVIAIIALRRLLLQSGRICIQPAPPRPVNSPTSADPPRQTFHPMEGGWLGPIDVYCQLAHADPASPQSSARCAELMEVRPPKRSRCSRPAPALATLTGCTSSQSSPPSLRIRNSAQRIAA